LTPLPILHVITRLIVGGAQKNAMLTAALLGPRRYAVDIISGPQTDLEVNLIKRDLCAWVPFDILPCTQLQLRTVVLLAESRFST
jgi:hypothetical protein